MSARSLGRKAEQRAPKRSGANLLFTVIAVVGCIHALAILTLEISRAIYTAREVTRLERDITSLELEAANLEGVLAHRNDADYREQLARRQGFIYPDEARYVTVFDPTVSDPPVPDSFPVDSEPAADSTD